MKLDKDDHEDFVQCMLATDGVSLSQATAYENGDVMTKDGRTFCSQQAIKQFRMQPILIQRRTTKRGEGRRGGTKGGREGAATKGGGGDNEGGRGD